MCKTIPPKEDITLKTLRSTNKGRKLKREREKERGLDWPGKEGDNLEKEEKKRR